MPEASVGSLGVDLGLNTARFRSGLDKAKKSTERFSNKAQKSFQRTTRHIKSMTAGLLAAGSATAAIAKFISVNREFDKLNAQLITATGSIDGASVAFAELERFAKTTPFALGEAVTGFTRLVNLGLDPSTRALTSMGNTASAQGKRLIDFIEAVADASTAEFERLKEFGIKARNEGDKVAFTFKGATTRVKNSAEDITEFLIRIGETDFAGAMEERAKTLDGALSNLSDSFEGVFRAVSGKDSLTAAVQDFAGVLDTVADALKVYNSGVDGSKGATTEFGSSLITTAEAGIRMGAAFEKLGRRLGGIGEQLKAAISLDFDEIKRITFETVGEIARIDARANAAVARLRERVEVGSRVERFAAGQDPDKDPLSKFKTKTELGVTDEDETAQLKVFRELDKHRRDLFDAQQGRESEMTEWFSDQLDKRLDRVRKTSDQMRAMNERAAQNMQDAFSDFLFDPFSEGLRGMVEGFLTAIRRMVADKATLKLFNLLGAQSGKGGILGAIGGFFGGPRSEGGPVSPGRAFLVGERGPELFIPGRSGQVVANGAMGANVTFNNEFNVQGGGDARAIAAAVEVAQASAVARIQQMIRQGRL